MKTQKKNTQKKLSLSKETLVRLNQMQMTKIVGGYNTVGNGTVDYSHGLKCPCTTMG